MCKIAGLGTNIFHAINWVNSDITATMATLPQIPKRPKEEEQDTLYLSFLIRQPTDGATRNTLPGFTVNQNTTQQHAIDKPHLVVPPYCYKCV
ncbi:unnamed protein product [Adineta ricciae]|uniref:Uncharacterized protein n=1 Tax=Adineta ricciae TaxID=249248 RepID=A0A814VWZ8_ADIRI|nr:unnamed protein product [Adineta ricciae]